MNQAQLLEYLETLSSAPKMYAHTDRQFCCYEDLMLAHGRIMSQENMPSDVEPSKPKECFGNSQDLVFANSKFTYIEGYVKNFPKLFVSQETGKEKPDFILKTRLEPQSSFTFQ